MPLFEVAFLTKDEHGKEEVAGPYTVVAANERAAIAMASWDTDEEFDRSEAQVIIRPFN